MDNVKCYAEALFSLAVEENKCDKVYEDTRIALGALSGNGEYFSILDTPRLSINERLGMIDSAFGSLDGHLINLIKILAEAKRALNEVKDEVSKMAIGIASAVIERDVNEVEHKEMIDEFITNMGKCEG